MGESAQTHAQIHELFGVVVTPRFLFCHLSSCTKATKGIEGTKDTKGTKGRLHHTAQKFFHTSLYGTDNVRIAASCDQTWKCLRATAAQMPELYERENKKRDQLMRLHCLFSLRIVR